MASQSSISTAAQLPSLSSCLRYAHEWLGEDYASSVVRLVLDSREHIPPDIKRTLDSSIRNSDVRVPGAGFQVKDPQDAPTHHLVNPVLRKMQVSDELTEAILRAWVAIKSELYESVVQHLQWNDEPTYGPDRKERTFRGYWEAKDWQTNFNQFLADRTGYNRSDAGLMLWYVSGKLPPPIAEFEDPGERVDFEKWKSLLLALSPDASQWDSALEFATAIAEIVQEKKRELTKNAVKQLKTKLDDIWLEYSPELTYLEKDIGSWSATNDIHPEAALQTLAQVTNLETLLSQYRPIRDQALIRSVESSRAGRRAELESQIILTVNELEPIIFSTDSANQEPAPADEPESLAVVASADTESVEPPDLLTLVPAPAESDDECSNPVMVELPVHETEEEPAAPAPVASDPPDNEFNASILAGLMSLREDMEQLKAQLVQGAENKNAEPQEADSAPDSPVEAEIPPAADSLAGLVLEAEEKFSGQLIFRLNGESWVEGNPYEDPQAVLDALEWLAATYVPARQGEVDFAALNDSLYKACRWKYSNNLLDSAFFQNEGEYRMLVNGKAYFLNETIGKGAGQDPVNTIRIAFYWDRQRARAVIGYIGQHRLEGNDPTQ